MKLLVFDMDGVLVDSTDGHRRAFSDLWARYGVAGPDYRSIAGRPTREVVASYTRDVEEWTAFKQERAREYLRREPVVFEDVLPCLKAARRQGVRMAVATGASRQTALLLLRRAAIDGFFDFTLAAEDVSAGKPDPELYCKAVTRAGMAAAETVVVEDSTSGLAAAIAAGLRVGCVRSGLQIASPYFLGSYAGLREFAAALGVQV